eukprot:Rmarinus@m.13530
MEPPKAPKESCAKPAVPARSVLDPTLLRLIHGHHGQYGDDFAAAVVPQRSFLRSRDDSDIRHRPGVVEEFIGVVRPASAEREPREPKGSLPPRLEKPARSHVRRIVFAPEVMSGKEVSHVPSTSELTSRTDVRLTSSDSLGSKQPLENTLSAILLNNPPLSPTLPKIPSPRASTISTSAITTIHNIPSNKPHPHHIHTASTSKKVSLTSRHAGGVAVAKSAGVGVASGGAGGGFQPSLPDAPPGVSATENGSRTRHVQKALLHPRTRRDSKLSTNSASSATASHSDGIAGSTPGLNVPYLASTVLALKDAQKKLQLLKKKSSEVGNSEEEARRLLEEMKKHAMAATHEELTAILSRVEDSMGMYHQQTDFVDITELDLDFVDKSQGQFYRIEEILEPISEWFNEVAGLSIDVTDIENDIKAQENLTESFHEVNKLLAKFEIPIHDVLSSKHSKVLGKMQSDLQVRDSDIKALSVKLEQIHGQCRQFSDQNKRLRAKLRESQSSLGMDRMRSRIMDLESQIVDLRRQLVREHRSHEEQLKNEKTKTKDLRNALKESRLAAAKCEGFNTTSTAALIDTILSEEETEDERKSDSQSASSLNAKSTIMSPTASPSSSFTRGRTKRSTRSLSLQPGMEHSRHTSSVGLGSVDEYEENDFGVSPRQSSVSVADAVVDDLEKGGDKPDYVGDHLGDQVRLAELRGIEVGLKAGMDRMKQRLVTTSELHATEMQALKGQYDRVRERLESSNELLTKEVESLKKELQTEEMTNVGRMRGEMTRQMEEKYEQKELQLRREFEDHLREVRNNHLKEISALEKSKYIKSFTAPVLTVEPVGLLMEESTQTDDSLFPLQPSTRSGISASSEQLLVPRASAGGLAAPHKVSSPCSPNPNAEETPQPSDAAEASSAVLEAAAAFRAKKKTRDVGTQHAVEMAFSWIAFVDRILAASDGDEEREESKVRVRAEVDAGKVGEQRVTVTYDLLAELIEATTSDDVIIEDNIMEAIDTNDSKRIISLFQGRQKVIQFERGIIQNLMNDHEEQAKIQDEVWREKTKELHQEIVNLNSELEISKSELETAKGQLATFEHEMSRSRRTRGRRRTSRLRSSLGKPKRASDVDETISEGSESDLVAPKPVSDPEVHVSPSSRDAKSTEQSVMAFVMTYHAEAQTSPTPGLEPLSLRRRKSITIDSLDLDENSRRRSIDMRSQPCPDSPEAAEGRSGAPRRRKVDRSQRAVRSLPGSRSGSRQTGRTDSRQPARPSSVRPANSQTHEGSRQAAKPQRGVGEGRSGAGPARTHGGQAKGKRRQVASARERGAHTHAGRTRQDGDGDEKPGKHSRGSGRLRRTTSSLLDYARSPEGAAALSNLDETTKRRHRALGRMLRSLARHSTMVGVDDEAVGESGCEKGDKRPKGLKTSKGEKGTTFKGKRRGTKIKRTKMFRGGVENKGCGEKRSTLGRDNGGENVIRESLLERLMERLSALRDVMEVPRRAFKIIARELGRLQCGACGARLYIPRNSIRQAYKKAVAVESVKLPDSSSVLFRGLGKLSCLSNDEFRKRLSGQVRGWRPSGVYRDARALTEGFPTKGRGAAVQGDSGCGKHE